MLFLRKDDLIFLTMNHHSQTRTNTIDHFENEINSKSRLVLIWGLVGSQSSIASWMKCVKMLIVAHCFYSSVLARSGSLITRTIFLI